VARETLTINSPPKGAPEKTLRDHVEKVAKSLKAQRSDDEGDWHSIADYSGYGEVPGLIYNSQGKQRPRMRALMDDHPIIAFRTIQSGMYSGLSSPNRPWLRFRFADDDLNDYQPGAIYLDQLERLIYAMFDASNFYQVARQNYGEMARFGPAAGIMTEHPLEIAPCLPLPIGTFWLGMNDAFKVDTLLRQVPMTVDQVVKKFVAQPGRRMDWSAVDPRVKEKWDRSNYDHVIQVWQLAEPGDGTRFNSVMWDANDQRENKLLEAKSYYEQPFWGPRWDTRGYGGYGRGVGHDCLASMRELHMASLRGRNLEDLLAKPPTAGPAKDLDMRPGAHTYVADMSSGVAAQPVYKVDPNAITVNEARQERLRNAIDRLTYADLFMAITNMPGVQPRNVEELLKRDEEKLTQIGPVVEMVNDDMLPIAVERMIGIAARGDLLPDAPEELQGRELKVEFVSVLAMAQKMLGLSTTERVVGFVGSLGQIFGPQVLDKIDPDELVDDYAQRANLPAKAVRDKAAVESMRASRQQNEQMANMAAMAEPAKTATEAAQNIAEMSNEAARY
jgi:hypothetical protein